MAVIQTSPMVRVSWPVVSCGVRLSEVGLSEIRKPQVRILSYQRNSLNIKAEESYQRRLHRVPSTKPSLLVPAAHQAKPLFIVAAG